MSLQTVCCSIYYYFLSIWILVNLWKVWGNLFGNFYDSVIDLMFRFSGPCHLGTLVTTMVLIKIGHLAERNRPNRPLLSEH